MALKDTIKRIFVYSLLGITILLFYILFDRFKWKDYSSKYEGTGYTFYSDLPDTELAHFAQLYEAFRDYFEQTYEISTTKRLKAYLFQTSDSYIQFIRRLGRLVPKTPFGFYVTRFALIMCNCQTGLGTVTHEFAHHLIYRTPIEKYPWLKEGFSAYFEKFIGIMDKDGQLSLSFGYFSQWRFQEALSFKHKGLATLRSLFDADSPDVVQSLARSFILFVHEKNKLPHLIENVYIYKDSRVLIENTLSASLEEIEIDWHAWMEQSRNNSDILLIESSRIYTQEAIQNHKPPIEWDFTRNRFTLKKG